MKERQPIDAASDTQWLNRCFFPASLEETQQHQGDGNCNIDIKQQRDLPAAYAGDVEGRQEGDSNNEKTLAQTAHHHPTTSDISDTELRCSIEAWPCRLSEEDSDGNTERGEEEEDHCYHREQVKQVFTDAQRMAYIGLCYLTSLEIVHDYLVGGSKDLAYARMSADNWQRKLMRSIYIHMGVEPSEIHMIESLSKHHIAPADLVQHLGQAKTVQIHQLDPDEEDAMLEERWPRRRSTPHDVDIDMRWTIVCDLLLLFLSAESLDARSRVLLARLSQQHLGLAWTHVLDFEKRISNYLLLNSVERNKRVVANASGELMHDPMLFLNQAEKTTRNKERRKRRYAMIGLAMLGGGAIMGVSVGLMAPLIAGGLGTILSTAGVSGASGFLSGTAGIALITGSATGIGGGLGAKSMKRRMKTINTFDFVPVALNDQVNCIISVSGWLPKKGTKDAAALPFSTLDPMMGDHYTIYWEPEMLENLGSAFRIFATEAVSFSIQQALAHTIMGALLAGLAWPLALTKLGYLVDNPWNNGLDRARLAGLILADTIMNRNLGARPVTLVGYSLGARVIFFCLSELARMNAFGLVEHVALFGTPVSASAAQWQACASVVAGRFVNGYCSNDWLLGFLFRASTAGLRSVAGLRPLRLEGDTKIENIDCTGLLHGHLSYRARMPQLLERAGFLVTSDDAKDRVLRETEGDAPALDLSLAKDLEHFRPATMKRGSGSFVSSLSSGKASILYPPPKTSCFLPPEPNDENTPESEIIAEIIAVSKRASSSSHCYSSLSSGRASLASEHRRSLSALQRSRDAFDRQSSPLFFNQKYKRRSDPGTTLFSVSHSAVCQPHTTTVGAGTLM